MSRWKYWSAAVVALAIFAVYPARPAPQARPQGAAPGENPQFEQLVDRYIAAARTTGGAAAPGRPRGPGDDGSAAFYERQVDTSRSLLKELHAIDRKTLTFDEDLDYRYLEGLLKSNITDGEKLKRWQQDPRIYLPAGLFLPRGGINVDQSRPAESAARFLEQMKAIPARLENGKKNLTQYVALWVEPSKKQLDSTIGVFQQDVPRLAERVPPMREALLAEVKRALAALEDFRQFLEKELPRRPVGEWRVGKDVLNFRMREVYLIRDMDADTLYDWGRRGYAEQLHVLERAALQADPHRSWQQIEREHQETHPSAESVVYDYLQATRRARDWLVEKDLVSFPAGARDPEANRLLVRLVYGKLGLDPRWGPEQREEYLRGRNLPLAWAMMTHEVYPGHGLVELWSQRNPRKLRRAESQSYANQSWCYYVEWFLAPEFGFYPRDKEADYRVEMERNKLWRYARVIYELGMHMGYVSVNEAVQLMHDGVLFSPQDSFLEVEATSQGSVRGDAVCTWGYHEYLRMRDDYFARMGALGREGSIKDFNDRVLKIGMLPISLIREALLHQIEEEQRQE